ncbi:MAG TPA: cation:proton antiporter, partial [Bacteroidota bacterium]|nr:cation:proton antiporter [Bacteroidota bacterium]
METAPVILFVGLLVFLAHWFAGIFSRTRIPDALMLIVIGLILGPVVKIVRPEHFGQVGPVFATIALVIILFEGGTDLRTEVLRKSWQYTIRLSVVGFVATALLVAWVTVTSTPLGPVRSLMLGAIVGGTASAIVIPLVKQLTLKEESRTVLVLESVVTDVLCIVVALGLFEAYQFGEVRPGLILGHLIASFLMAALIGVVSAFGWSILLHRVRTLQYSILTTPAFVFVVFGIAEMLGYSGAIASLAFGIAIGNTQLFHLKAIRRFVRTEPISLNETEKVLFGELVFILKTFFFVYVGLSIQLNDVASVSFGLLLTLLIFLVRIPVLWISRDRQTSPSDASYMAIMVPKGLAAAVLASIPLQLGIPGGDLIQNVTFAVLLFSILLNSILVPLVERTAVGAFYRW